MNVYYVSFVIINDTSHDEKLKINQLTHLLKINSNRPFAPSPLRPLALSLPQSFPQKKASTKKL